ncbi:MAG TPA: chemotaxis protein CheW [Kineosporiaceae bacterium]|nr:chemotaxis protein CheW [Kineosporiaceae bacterium]
MTQLSTFMVGRYLFGVDVALVQEIMRVRSMTPVPLAVPEIAGLINLRGEVLTAVDLRILFGLDVADASRNPINIVVRVDDEPVSLLVDAIGGVIDVSTLPFQSTPATVDQKARALIMGAYTLPDQLLLALDARKVLADLAVTIG